MKVGPIATAALVLSLILSIPVPAHGRFIDDLFNAGHAPLFGVAALVLLRLAPRKRKYTVWEYLIVLFFTALIGILTELVQGAEGGDAEVRDAVADFLGAASFLVFHYTIIHKFPVAFRWLLRFSALAVLLAVFKPPILSGMETIHRNRSFPILFDFDSVWDLRRCRPDDAKFEIAAAPDGAAEPRGKRMVKVTFEPARYSVFVIDELYPDWTGWGQLGFTVYSDLSSAVRLALTIQDMHYSSEHSYDTELTIRPGINAIHISLGALAAHRMDMTAIRRIMLIAEQPANPFSLYLDGFHLE